MSDFFRFQHTPHLAWLGQGSPRDDKVLSPAEAEVLLCGEVVVEEKLDGANLGISVGPDGNLRVQNRGQYLESPFHGQFSRLGSWLAAHRERLESALFPDLMVFGEWCAARHSLGYTSLPDWFLGFDVYDRKLGRFWSTGRRDALFRSIGITCVPKRFQGKTQLNDLKRLLEQERSLFQNGPMEGLVVRKEDQEWLAARAKLVRADFTQAITQHWIRRGIEWNRLGADGTFASSVEMAPDPD
ncbi:MAG: RNA ligase family protein [Verrucomicrobiales bacterium]|nr:RNA ligase family protein [Verrucomicrobiales bacterium]